MQWTATFFVPSHFLFMGNQKFTIIPSILCCTFFIFLALLRLHVFLYILTFHFAVYYSGSVVFLLFPAPSIKIPCCVNKVYLPSSPSQLLFYSIDTSVYFTTTGMESSIINGQALSVIAVDDTHILDNLQKRIRHYYKADPFSTDLVEVRVVQEPGSPVLALLCFTNSETVRRILTEKVSHSVESSKNGVQYIKGSIALGRHTLTVEGCVHVEDAELEDPTQLQPQQRSVSPVRRAEEEMTCLFFIFTLLFCRPRPGEESRMVGGRPKKDFLLTPFIVYQMLGEEYQPSGIEVLPKNMADTSPKNNDITRVVVRLPARYAADVIEHYDHSYVELMSPPSNAPQSGPVSQKCEARFRVFAKRSDRPLTCGQNTEEGMVLPQELLLADAHDTVVLQRLQERNLFAFKRRRCDDLGQPGASDGPTPRQPHGQFHQENRAPRPNDNGAPNHHHYYNNHNNNNAPRAGHPSGDVPHREATATRYIQPPAQRVAAPVSSEPHPHSYTPAVQPSPVVVPTHTPVAVTPVVAVQHDQIGPLPPHWRPIFSEEYKQTYYAYKDPVTGVETTTWTRP
ncbi:hypothetical protein AGDE_14682 [Angomonas deanei]|uniref:Uncharacterized protein n=1 Tax=Angomonas deanei TaxID=59799 RepID=A0A7G2CD54_9TRYP|nr:hypothetical protein AGDE_14682 [Angomonas deanei]CAD2217756.1 hypothetical protein, conserved [Angomonas deanei]|eukprot:EPY20423.1 hypothetical protein AGDE_14682 [Angomonas deanei]